MSMDKLKIRGHNGIKKKKRRRVNGKKIKLVCT